MIGNEWSYLRDVIVYVLVHRCPGYCMKALDLGFNFSSTNGIYK